MTQPVVRRRLPKRTKDETRALLLRAAVDLLRERAETSGDDVVASVLAHVRATDIADRATGLVLADLPDDGVDRAAVTTGAVYQVWPRQADLQADLLFHVADLQAQLVFAGVDVAEQVRADAARGAAFTDVVAGVVARVRRYYLDDPLFRVELGFLVAARDDRVRAALAHRRERFAVTADEAWQAVLDAFGRRVRPPHRLRDLTLAVAAQITGSVVLGWSDPDGPDLADGAGESGPWAWAAAVVVERFTEPAPRA